MFTAILTLINLIVINIIVLILVGSENLVLSKVSG